jgi:branched-subunit amino acid transport protein AzlD
MRLTTGETIPYIFAMGGVILFTRVFPFLFFRSREEETNEKATHTEGQAPKTHSRRAAFLNFVEKTAPPASMTVLACHAIAGGLFSPGSFTSFDAFTHALSRGIPLLAASVLTVLLHLWKRNTLLSIFGGTGLYMFLSRVLF